MFGDNFFYSSLSGELATTSNASAYISRVDNGDFLKYSLATSTNSWTVTDKNGTIYIFGSTTASRQDDPGNSAHVYRWMLQQTIDTNGNIVTYQYYKDAGQIYPSAILYTGTATTTGIFEIDFLRTARTDNNELPSNIGFPVTNNYLINEIDAKINGTWALKYVLGYTTGNNGTRSLLNTVTESGQDLQSNVTTLPATTFTYKSYAPTGLSQNLSWSMPTGFPYDTTGYYILDINGDGLPDVALNADFGSGSTFHNVWINKGDGNWTDEGTTTWSVPAYMNYPGTGFADLNGDGLPDVYYSYSGGSTNVNSIYYNNGSGWTLSSSTMPLNMDPSFTGTYVIDVNGDGLADVVRNTNYGSSSTYHNVFINNGDGTWTDEGTTTWQVPVYMNTAGTGFADLNGDGLPDVYYSDGGSNNLVYLNTGHGWTLASGWSMPISFAFTPANKQAQLVDINGDGLVDVVNNTDYGGGGTNHDIYINKGNGTWTLKSAATDISIPTYVNYPGVGMVDLNGDGAVDLYQSDGTTNAVYLNNGGTKRTDLLMSAQTIQGGKTGFDYTATPLYRDISNNMLNPNLPYGLITVSAISTNDGLGTIGTTTYQYKGGLNYYISQTNHQLAGFSQLTQIDPASNTTKTYFHQFSGADSAHGEYQDNIAKLGKAYRVEQYDGSNNLFAKTITKWDLSSLGGLANFVFPDQSVVSAYDGLSSHSDKAESYTYATTTGNITQKIQWGQVTGNDDGTFSDIGSDKGTENISYAVSTTTQVAALPYLDTVLDQSSNKIRETRNYYDNLPLASTTLGNLTKQESWITGTSYASTTKSYNSYGLIAAIADARGDTTTYLYDGYNLYPATTTNALSQKTQNLYNYTIGKVTQTVDANGATTTTAYDGLGRQLTLSEPDPTTGSLVTKTTYAYTDSSTPGSTSVLETDYLNSASSTNTYMYADGLGRNLQQRTLAEGTNTYSVKDWTYNNLGLLNSESLPYFASSTARTTATSTSALFASYTYDPLLRVSKITNAVGSTTSAYKNWTTTTTDANGKIKDLTKDAYGNLATVVEHISGTLATTTYAWDLNKSLTKITDASGNVRNFTYDGLGRRLTAEDLHTTVDTTYGTTTFAYDATNNLTQKVDPKNQTINYTYDVLNRPLTESGSGGGGTTVIFLTTTGINTWTVPSDWNSSNNSIEVIGAGGGGSSDKGIGAGSGGGGGGAYSKITNLSLTAGNNVTYQVGIGGAGGATSTAGGFNAGSNGNDTFFNRTSGSANTCADTTSLCSKGGIGATTTIALGGQAGSGTGTTKNSGGAGGSAANASGDGGGGAAGPNGNGKSGGSGTTGVGTGGAGGGGADGGSSSAGGVNTTGGVGGAGGNGTGGTGAGTGGTGGSVGGVGSTGGGGGGGEGTNAGVQNATIGGAGGSGTEWDSVHGSGGGGGGGGGGSAGTCSSCGGARGGLYGGGGGSGGQIGTGSSSAGGTGGQGLIVITYTPVSGGIAATYVYDNCTNGKGRLCNWINASASSTLQYDPDGNIKQETRNVSGTNYTMGYVYDRLGNVASSTYPDGSIVWNIYDNAGRLDSVQRKESTDNSFSNVITHSNYSPMGQVSYRLWGNGAETFDTYDPSKLYRLTNILTINN